MIMRLSMRPHFLLACVVGLFTSIALSAQPTWSCTSVVCVSNIPLGVQLPGSIQSNVAFETTAAIAAINTVGSYLIGNSGLSGSFYQGLGMN